MRWVWQCIALLTFSLLAGCFSTRVFDQSIAAGVAAARYHSANGTWPQTREEMLAFNNEERPLTLRKNDEVWLHQNNDGSATITWLETGWSGGTGTAIRVVPPRHPSTSPHNQAQASDVDDYTFEAATVPDRRGRRLD